jgi:hypothetical protein
MQKLDGPSLRDRITEARQLLVDEAARIATEVAGGSITPTGTGAFGAP